jgi:hypothetical protein
VAWEVLRLKGSPAAFVGVVYADDAESAIAVAIVEPTSGRRIRSGPFPGCASMSRDLEARASHSGSTATTIARYVSHDARR